MDNRIFNVNGYGSEQLACTLKLAFFHGNFGKEKTCNGWIESPKHGLILLSYFNENDKVNKFPVPLYSEQICPIIEAWLNDLENDKKKLETFEMIGYDANEDHDGHNKLGWRVFCENWGHVNDMHGAICAVKPAYMWFGK